MSTLCNALHLRRVVILTLVAVGLLRLPARAQVNPVLSPQARQLVDYVRERKHAYERGDVQAWGMHVAEKCKFIQSGGRMLSKAQFLSEMAPFVGYTFTADIDEVRASEFGDTVVLTYREKEIRDYGTQRSENAYLDAETYTRLDARWQLILWTENLVPNEPALVKINPQIYDEYAGTYEINPKATFTVTREGGKLMGQYSGDQKFEMLPAGMSNFFVRGDSAEYLFVRDRSGRVVGHIYRAEGVDLKYKKKR